MLACVEVMPYSGGLTRNIVQCLHYFNIPLYLSHTVTKIEGEGRLTGVTVQKVDENRAPVPGTEMHFDCDTLLLSVGLIPENELSGGAGVEMDRRHNGPMVYENMETSVPGIFAAGNLRQCGACTRPCGFCHGREPARGRGRGPVRTAGSCA